MARVPCTITHEPDAVDNGGRPRRCACGYVGGLNVMAIDARIPKTSLLVSQVVGAVAGGGRVRVTLWDAFTSHGYKTNYQHVRTRLLEVSRSWKANSWNNARDVSRYTGRRFDDAQPMYDALARQVTPDGAALAVPA